MEQDDVKLEDIKLFLLDMDGTIYLGDELIDGAKEFLTKIKEQGKEYIFLTNNSSKSKAVYKQKLARLDIEADEEEVFTSGEATIIYLNNNKKCAKIFLLGTPLLEKEFMDAGFILVKGRDESPDFVVLGFDTSLTYEKLWIACDYIREGVHYIATHPDFNCPLAEGRFMPDAGAIISFIEASTGERPLVIGKPNKLIIDSIIDKYGHKREDIAMVGDRLYTDIKVGENSGISTILVLSGETQMQEYQDSDVTASLVYPSVKEIAEELD